MMKHSLFIIGTVVLSLSLATAANAYCFTAECDRRKALERIENELYTQERRIKAIEREAWFQEFNSLDQQVDF